MLNSQWARSNSLTVQPNLYFKYIVVSVNILFIVLYGKCFHNFATTLQIIMDKF